MQDKVLDISLRARTGVFSLKLDLSLPLSGVIGILGPNGAGKSSLLRHIAGFDTAQQGHIRLGDQVMLDTAQNINMPAHERPVGYMFQDARLFSHLTISQNLLYAEKRNRSESSDISFERIVEHFSLADLLDRLPQSLSGGEAQRVALARTLLTRPALLLLDEPFSALDRARKKQAFTYLDQTTTAFGIPALYVSHDIYEISRLAHMVIRIQEGRIVATGPAEDILNMREIQLDGNGSGVSDTNPLSVFDAAVKHHDHCGGLTRLAAQSFEIDIPLDETLILNSQLRFFIHARDVIIATALPKQISIRNCLEGRIDDIYSAPASPFVSVTADIGGQKLSAIITKAAFEALALVRGRRIYLLVKSVTIDHL